MNDSLTQMQLAGLTSEANVAEGYPRQRLTSSQQRIVERLPELMDESLRTPMPILDERAQAAFFAAVGQHRAPIGQGRIVSFYASSLAIDVVARCLGDAVSSVGVVSPTLDCVPILLRARGLHLVPIGERRFASADPFAGLEEVGCVFGANPNNPTGAHLPESGLRRLAEACAEREAILVLDCCFRGFDPRTQFDHYAVLDDTGVEYVVLEDTGKLWPMTGLKLGFAVSSARNRLPLAEAASDVILSPPGLVALLVEALSQDMAAGGMEQIHSLISENRQRIAAELEGCMVAHQVDGTSRVSVSRVEVDRPLSATRLWGEMMRHGVCAVPCRPFYWSRPSQGEKYLRLALSRDPEVVTRAAVTLRECAESRS